MEFDRPCKDEDKRISRHWECVALFEIANRTIQKEEKKTEFIRIYNRNRKSIKNLLNISW